MEKTHIAAIILLAIALIASLYFMFHFQSKLMGATITLPILVALLLTAVSERTEYVLSPIKNYALWYDSPEGQASGWDAPTELNKKIQYQVMFSADMPGGRYFNYQYLNPEEIRPGEISHLTLMCAPKSWNPKFDFNYNNHLGDYETHIEPRSPSQARNSARFHGWKTQSKDQLELEIRRKQDRPSRHRRPLPTEG